MKPLTIAIDGLSACGKSTLARALARALDYVFVDSGAMYRAVTLYVLRRGIAPHDAAAIEAVLPDVEIGFVNHDGNNHTYLNGSDVEEAIRDMQVSAAVSPVSAIPAVRRALVAQQQRMGHEGGIVMDGRDIGTVVFPNAEVKIFMTAATPVRVQRRLDELRNKGLDHLSAEEVQLNLEERDLLDSTRADSPLRRADDAVVLDNSDLTPEAQLAWALALVEARRAALAAPASVPLETGE
jgi:cytidylate kinase